MFLHERFEYEEDLTARAVFQALAPGARVELGPPASLVATMRGDVVVEGCADGACGYVALPVYERGTLTTLTLSLLNADPVRVEPDATICPPIRVLARSSRIARTERAHARHSAVGALERDLDCARESEGAQVRSAGAPRSAPADRPERPDRAVTLRRAVSDRQ